MISIKNKLINFFQENRSKIPEEETDFREKISKIIKDQIDIQFEGESETKRKIDRLVRDAVNSQVKIYKIAIIAFLAGIGFLIYIGIATKGEIIEKVASSTVWHTVTTGSVDDYKKFVSKNEFYEALASYHTELVRTFLVPHREPLIRANEILRVGRIHEDVQIYIGSKDLEGRVTERCFKNFDHSAQQAVLVIPSVFDREEFSWYDCSFGWPKISMSLEHSGKQLDDIELIGVRRNGQTNQLGLVVTSTVAKKLALPGWENFKTNTFGKIWISKVDGTPDKCDTSDIIIKKATGSSELHPPSNQTSNDFDVDKIHDNDSEKNSTIVRNDSNDNLLTKPIENSDKYVENALELYNKKKHTESFEAFQKIISSTNDEKIKIYSIFMSGECLFAEKKYDQAILQYQKIIANYHNHPKAASAMLKQAISFEKLHDNETANIIYQRILDIYHSSPEANISLLRLQKSESTIQPSPSEDTILPPPSQRLSNNNVEHALELCRKSNYYEAIEEIDALSANSKDEELNIENRFLLGECLFEQKEYDQAILQFQKIITAHRNHPKAASSMLNQAIAFEKLEDEETAKIIYQKITQVYKGYPESNIALERLGGSQNLENSIINK